MTSLLPFGPLPQSWRNFGVLPFLLISLLLGYENSLISLTKHQHLVVSLEVSSYPLLPSGSNLSYPLARERHPSQSGYRYLLCSSDLLDLRPSCLWLPLSPPNYTIWLIFFLASHLSAFPSMGHSKPPSIANLVPLLIQLGNPYTPFQGKKWDTCPAGFGCLENIVYLFLGWGESVFSGVSWDLWQTWKQSQKWVGFSWMYEWWW